MTFLVLLQCTSTGSTNYNFNNSGASFEFERVGATWSVKFLYPSLYIVEGEPDKSWNDCGVLSFHGLAGSHFGQNDILARVKFWPRTLWPETL